MRARKSKSRPLPLVFLGSLLAISHAGCVANVDEASGGNGNQSTSGSGASGGGQSTSPLACDTYAWCTNWTPNSSRVTMPNTKGGTVTDGVYRLEEGSSSPLALVIQGNQFVRVLGVDLNLSGTFSISGDTLSLVNDGNCDDNGIETYSSVYETSYTYAVTGNDLYLNTECSDYDDFCNPTWRLTRVSDLCAGSENFSCSGSDCECRAWTDRGFPERSDTSNTCRL